MSAVGGLFILQLLGVNLQPIWAVGGAGSIIVGLATQTLLTNSLMGFNFVSAGTGDKGVMCDRLQVTIMCV